MSPGELSGVSELYRTYPEGSISAGELTVTWDGQLTPCHLGLS